MDWKKIVEDVHTAIEKFEEAEGITEDVVDSIPGLDESQKKTILEMVQNDTFKKMFNPTFKNPTFKFAHCETDLVEEYRNNIKQKERLDATIAEMSESERKQFWRKYHNLGDDNIQEKLDEVLIEVQILRSELKKSSL